MIDACCAACAQTASSRASVRWCGRTRVGASTLAAHARCRPSGWKRSRDLVSRLAEVNHNYEREHRAEPVVRGRRRRCRSASASVPATRSSGPATRLDCRCSTCHWIEAFRSTSGFRPGDGSRLERRRSPTARRLLAALEDGLPLVAAALSRRSATQLGLGEADGASTRCAASSPRGVITPASASSCAITSSATAPTPWRCGTCPTTRVGRRRARLWPRLPCVTLCYRRPRRLPAWPYNLFCMIHGRDRATVAGAGSTEAIAAAAGLDGHAARGAVQPPPLQAARRAVTRCRAGVKDAVIDDVDRRIVNALQGGFPLRERPFRDAAREPGPRRGRADRGVSTGCATTGVLTRFGPLYDAERLGGGVSLAAMAVPQERFDEVAALVNALPEVAHNYEREPRAQHVVRAGDRSARAASTTLIARNRGGDRPDGASPCPSCDEYFVGLRVRGMSGMPRRHRPPRSSRRPRPACRWCARPIDAVADKLGLDAGRGHAHA